MRSRRGSWSCAERGQPWNEAAHNYASQRFDSFKSEFAKWMRGDIRVKSDKAVSASDIANYNLVLFGDPGQQQRDRQGDRQVADPVDPRARSSVGSQKFSAGDHALVMVYPNPLNPQSYVVLNTGHTFSANRITSGTESVFFPRLGDYAVLTTAGEVKVAGFFDEGWKIK